MKLLSKEHYEIMDAFEANMDKTSMYVRLDREQDKELWKKGYLYEHGETNNLFKVFRMGVAYQKCVNNLD